MRLVIDPPRLKAAALPLYPTQEALAKKAGITTVTVRSALAGLPVKATTVHALAKALGVKPLDIAHIGDGIELGDELAIEGRDDDRETDFDLSRDE